MLNNWLDMKISLQIINNRNEIIESILGTQIAIIARIMHNIIIAAYIVNKTFTEMFNFECVFLSKIN